MSRITVNDVDLYYEESGTGDPIVLVHGSWGEHGTWQAVAPGLAESHRVITYDRRGHSRSERPATPARRRDHEDDLAALIEALHAAPAHVVGSSYGGSVALGLAVRRPELVRRVAVHEPPLMGLVAEDPVVQPLLQEVGASMGAVLADIAQGEVERGTRRFMEEIALGPGGWGLLPPALREIAVQNAPAFVDDVSDPDAMAVDPGAVGRLPAPLLLTRGDKSDAWFHAVIAALARAAGHAEVRTFAGAGHAPHLTHPGDYVAAIAAFVSTAARRGIQARSRPTAPTVPVP